MGVSKVTCVTPATCFIIAKKEMKLHKEVWRPKKKVFSANSRVHCILDSNSCVERVVSLCSEDTTLGSQSAFRYRAFWETEYIRWFTCYHMSGCFSRVSV